MSHSIPGDPDGMRATAAQLRARAADVRAQAAQLRDRADRMRFQGPAADRLHARLAQWQASAAGVASSLEATAAFLVSQASTVEALQHAEALRLARH